MATVFIAPKHIDRPRPILSGGLELAEQENHRYTSEIREWLKSNGWNDNLSGATIKLPRGDGQAFYMIARATPLILLHLEIGDAKRLSKREEDDLNIGDVRRCLSLDSTINMLFGDRQ